jgi:Raf kinase inhibitor-like YbhB/YbcL family protein
MPPHLHSVPQFKMKLWTDAIDKNGFFDPRYTCDMDNSSPELRWSNPPELTQCFAVIAEGLWPGSQDSHEKHFCHWVVYNIPNTILHLPTGIPPQDMLPNGIRQGLNGLGKLGYFGPCPSRGIQSQRYVFRLYALNSELSLPSRLTREQLVEQMRDFIITTAEVEGRYQRLVERAG